MDRATDPMVLSERKKTMSTPNLGQAVLVTTAHRGVFFGYLVGEASKEKVTIKNARNCVYWTQQERGFLGLAAMGPSNECKVGPATPELTLWDITGVATVTHEAVQRWEASPWSR
jgi:hypothetical protein